MEVLGEWPKELDFEMNEIFSARSSYFEKRMQKVVMLRATFKVITRWCSDVKCYIIDRDRVSVTLALVFESFSLYVFILERLH